MDTVNKINTSAILPTSNDAYANVDVAKQAVVPTANVAHALSLLSEKPTLQQPKSLSMSNIANLSDEALQLMLGNDERNITVKSGLSAIKTRSDEKQAILHERLDNLKEQMNKAQNQGFLASLSKAFKYIALAFTAVASLATAAFGFVTANPAILGGSILLGFSAIDQIVSEATNGKVSLSSLVQEITKVFGDDKNIGKTIGEVLSAIIGLAAALLSGVGSSGLAASAGKLASLLKDLSNIANVVSSTTQVVNGGVNIAKSVNTKEIIDLESDNKFLEGLLMKIKATDERDSEYLKQILEKTLQLSDSIKGIIESSNNTLSAVVSNNVLKA